MKIIKKEARLTSVPKKLHVAAYCRVSKDSENLLHSLSAQISYYNDYIQGNTEWIFSGVYADESITGTNTRQRKEFQRMMQDCENGKIDIILCKSISRFARNTVDFLKAVRKLRELGIAVIFDREHINTLTADGEFLLTILASYAEEESISTSQNIKVAKRNKYKLGIMDTPRRILGYEVKNGHLEILNDEANLVRYIFKMCCDGVSPTAIARDLDQKGYRGIRGGKYVRKLIVKILENEAYLGKTVMQKYYCPKIHCMKKNKGQLPQYIIEETHEALIDEDTFYKAQEMLTAFVKYKPQDGWDLACLSSKAYCGICGKKLSRRTVHAKENPKTWVCPATEKRKSNTCDLYRIYEEELEDMLLKATNLGSFSDAYLQLEKILVFTEKVIFLFKNGEKKSIKRTMKQHIQNGCTCFTRRMNCGLCGGSVVAKKHRNIFCLKKGCSLKYVNHDELVQATREVLGVEDYELSFIANVNRVVIFEDQFKYEMKDGGIKKWLRK